MCLGRWNKKINHICEWTTNNGVKGLLIESLSLKIEDNVTNGETYPINDDTIRYLCINLLNGEFERVYVSTYRYKVFQKTSWK
ncbi:hypothetical protein BA065_03050 [Nanoarchaeota archaeon NZ13-N]|nr:MAG: hypothetical protein BA065_03050 [Nanoarchaeota archaeon NZ13-N]